MVKRFFRYDLSGSSADVKRRGTLLNIITLGVAALTLLAIVVLFLLNIRGERADTFGLYVASFGVLGGVFIVHVLGKSGRVDLGAILLLIIFTAAVSVADTPGELVNGRSIFYFVIPIMMASFLLRSYASFIIATFVSIEHILIWIFSDIPGAFSPYGLFGFFVFAIITWLAAQSLESALHEAREINRRLDELVEERTRELAETNAELAEANERLKELDQLKSKFVSDVTHELRTPISNISIYLEMVENALAQLNQIPQRIKDFLKILRNETARLNDLITDVLDLSRMEQEVSRIELEMIDFNPIVDKIVEANRMMAEAKGLEIAFDADPSLPKLFADSSQLEQVCTNLIANAINYTQKGSVKVSTTLENGEQCVFRVQDTGMGIGEDELDHLFDRFYRGRQASQSSIPGTGLGLSITKEIIEAHNGFIEVESEIGVGTIFSVYLPIPKDEHEI